MLTPWAKHKKRPPSIDKLRRYFYGKNDKYQLVTHTKVEDMNWIFEIAEGYVVGEKIEIVEAVQHIYYLFLRDNTVCWMPKEQVGRAIEMTYEECLLSSNPWISKWVRQFAND